MGTRLFFLFFLISLLGITQNDTIKFWIQFTDKQNSIYSTTNPSQFLSERAILRRENQNISIKENDLPVNKNYIDSVLNSGSFFLQNQSKWFNAITISTDDSSNINVLNNISFIQSIKNVQFLQKNTMKRLVLLRIQQNKLSFKLQIRNIILTEKLMSN